MIDKDIYLTKDIVKLYADKRKGISEDEIEELLESTIGYIHSIVRDHKSDVLAIELPYIGYIYKNFEEEFVPKPEMSPRHLALLKQTSLDYGFYWQVKSKSPIKKLKIPLREHEAIQNHIADNFEQIEADRKREMGS